jgi:RHS repeat-associated protein
VQGTLDLDAYAWPARSMTSYFRGAPPQEEPVWLGSIVTGQKDASGLFYRRNRYYDPQANQFTQEDPIGIAGGLNTYGFAGGDPVSYSDPYGLSAQRCPPACPIPGAGPAPLPLPTPEMAEGTGNLIDALTGVVGDALDAARDKIQIKFVTYTRTDPVSGRVYSGRTSGLGNPQSIARRRASSHPAHVAGFGPPVLYQWAVGAQGYAAIRGREQHLIDANGGAQSEGGTSANRIRGVSERNPLASIFEAAAIALFGPMPQ